MRASRSKYLDRLHNVSIRITGEEKNKIIDHAEKLGISVSELIEYAVWTFIRSEQGIPAPGPSQFAKITNEEVIRSYLTGETLLMPCGKESCTQIPVKLKSMEFCNTCNLRIG
jgi:antitoxin component of RelBE/YafQ-DinJ toxin-antitoxin module